MLLGPAQIPNNHNKINFLETLLGPICSLINSNESSDELVDNPDIATQFINKTIEKLEELTKAKENEKNNAFIIDELKDITCVSYISQIIPKVKNIVLSNDRLTKELKDVTNEFNETLEEQNYLEKQIKQYKENYESQINELCEQIKQLKQLYNDSCRSLHQKTLELQASQLKISSSKKMHESELKDEERKSQSQINLILSQCESEKRRLNDELSEKQQMFNQMSAACEKRKNKINELKSILQEKIENHKNSLNKQNEFFANKAKNDQENALAEILQLREFFDKVLSSAKAKSEEFERKLLESNERLITYESKMKQQAKKIAQIESEMKAQTISLKKIKTQADIKIKMMESKYKTDQITLVNKQRSDQEQVMKECEQSKKDLISLISSFFFQYCDSNNRIDDALCKEIIKRVNDDLENLKRQNISIRNMLGLSNNESVEEALSTLINHTR